MWKSTATVAKRTIGVRFSASVNHGLVLRWELRAWDGGDALRLAGQVSAAREDRDDHPEGGKIQNVLKERQTWTIIKPKWFCYPHWLVLLNKSIYSNFCQIYQHYKSHVLKRVALASKIVTFFTKVPTCPRRCIRKKTLKKGHQICFLVNDKVVKGKTWLKERARILVRQLWRWPLFLWPKTYGMQPGSVLPRTANYPLTPLKPQLPRSP